MKRCSGCGVLLQDKDINSIGYVEEKKLLDGSENILCRRCFRLRHYNENIGVDTENLFSKELIYKIKQEKALIVHVVNLFNFEETIINNINNIFSTDNILLVLNKQDLFLKTYPFTKLLKYINEYLKIRKLFVKDIVVVSGTKEKNLAELITKIEQYRKHKNVYFIGMTNVGKSTLLNKIWKSISKQEEKITTSIVPNTTLDIIAFPIDTKTYLFDTPGFNDKTLFSSMLSLETLKKITPNTYIRPKVFQLLPKQTLFIAGFVRLDYLSGDSKGFTTNFCNSLVIHRTKILQADAFYRKHMDDILQIPCEKERESLGKVIKKDFHILKDEKIDLVFMGLGFISIVGEAIINIYTFEKINIFLRKVLS